MEPGSRVELPPRGADLSFLSNNPDTDTPSKWLTFNSTPGGGNTTPGTAFGSPFWGSLAAANAQGNGSTPTTATFHTSRNSPKSYSPSKELNPFELSFFPKHNEHLLASNTASTSSGKDQAKEGSRPSSGGSKENVNPQAGNATDEAENVEGEGNTSLSSSVSSLKRPFSDALPAGSDMNSLPTSLQSDAAARVPMDASGHPLPSWKRPKIGDLHSANPSSSDLSSTAESGASVYALSPGNLNPSPDSGSPASSMVPTPSIQHAILPPNATPAAMAMFSGPGNAVGQDGKTAIPLEQIEVAKLAPGGVVANVNTVPVHPHQQHAYTAHTQTGQAGANSAINQSVPGSMSTTFNSQQQAQHQPGGHPYGGYTGYMPHNQQQQPIILPPKTLQQAQQQQRTVSPVTSHPPAHSARQSSIEQSHLQQSPVSANNNSNTIPYANGRGPARPSRSTRSSNHNNRRGSTAPIANHADGNESTTMVKQEEENMNIDDSSYSGNASFGAFNTATHNVASSGFNSNNPIGAGAAQGSSTQKTNGKKGKKNQQQQSNSNNERRASSVSGSSSGRKANNTTSGGGAGSGDYGAGNNANNGEGQGDDEDDGDDEHKRKAFLERNRQAACRSRQKKKEWINNLETHAARLQSENQSLAAEIDVLRKELFALRHTLSFHERSGCTASAPQSHHQHHHQQQQQPQPIQNVVPPPPSGSLPVAPPQQQQQQQQQQQPDWRQQQQPQSHQQPAAASSSGSYAPAFQSNVSHIPQAPTIVHTHPSPQPHLPSLQSAQQAPPPVHIQTQPQPLSASRPGLNGGPTLAPPALQGLNLQVPPQLHPLGGTDQQHLSIGSQTQRAPPKLNLSPASLQPQSLPGGAAGSLNPHHQNSQLPSHSNQLGTVGDINRPGSAGPTFGLLTPNFADLFNGAMGKLGNGGQTPGGFGAGLLFTPGGIMSSGGMLGGGTSSSFNNSTGYNMSSDLPNTFGLSIQDIPIRPASAPPTPSPAIDSRLMAPSQDYFSSKNLSSNLGTSAAFADFLAAYPNNAMHSNTTGSVLA